MKKNIAVTDAQGNEYEATWPKRARGLVKSGRARFVNETTICLACPPEHTEGHSMNMDDMVRQMNEQPQENALDQAAAAQTVEKQPDMAYITQKIDQILTDSEYLQAAIAQLENVEEAAARAIGNLVESRENTNQRMIGLLEKMLDDIRPQPVDPTLTKLEALQKILDSSQLEENHKFDLMNQAVQLLF